MRGYLVYIGAEGCKACAATTPVVEAIARELGVPVVHVDYFRTKCVIEGVEIDETPVTIYSPDGSFTWDNVLRGPAINKRVFKQWLQGRLDAASARGALFCGPPRR
jgi:thiol-disulfide isomerase/thioredoxin